ncbi:MAG: DNA-processing protein DprA [Burkholderiaceae bacterium]|nr:DNA-processing protein DprA [Burkholderiaceae bacterium]
MNRDELTAWLRLTLTTGVGDKTARKLLATFGLPERIFEQLQQTLQTCVTSAQARALKSLPPALAEQVDVTWQWLHTPAPGTLRAVVPLGHRLYPIALLETDDPPLMLYLLGPTRFLAPEAAPLGAQQCVAMVGSRNPTAQGQSNATEFARSLRASGLSIVSGLALGIDAAAHEGALADASDSDTTPATIAVVGTGLDRVYPRRNLDLAHRIAAHGLLVSEYPLGTPPLAGNFPKRNRIIAGLSQGTLVVEAAPASGSLITARLAAEQGREVFAIPGSIHAPQSRGCHALIRQGAKLVESAQDVLEELHLPTPVGTVTVAQETPTERPVDAPLLAALAFDPVGLDALVARTGMDTATLLVQLLELELDGAVARLPGGLFQRMARA